ncbi:MAG: hypothetical protein RLY45_1781 [Actinomycetota bacterium]
MLVVMVLRNPRPAWLMDLIRLEAGPHLRRDCVQFAVDAVPFVVGVGSQVHLGRRNRLEAAVALTHEYLPCWA